MTAGRRRGPQGGGPVEQTARAVAQLRQREEDNDSTLAARIAQLTAALTALAPQPGDLKLSPVSTVPAGWLACDGALVSRTTYADLFTAIGTTHGVGDGSTTFKLPNYAGRALVGAGAGAGLTARFPGNTFGDETHTLSVGETPVKSHSHGLNVAHQLGTAHNHTLRGMVAEGNQGSPQGSDVDTNSASSIVATAHNNVQPSAVAQFLIKT